MKRHHGGNIYNIARQSNIKAENILDFSANINPLGFTPRLKKLFTNLDTIILNYPDQDAHDLKAELAVYHELEQDYFLPGNGSVEFIYLLPDVVRPKSVLIVAPSFNEYESSYQRAKGVVFFFETREKDGFALQKKQLLDELKRGYSALYICNPANPTGVLVPSPVMKEIVTFAHKKGTTVIVDETFMDYAEAHSIKALVKQFDNLFVLRSMTKFFALPGLRAGYMIANPKALERLRERQEPWSMNALAQRAGIEALKDSAHIQKSLRYVTDAKKAFISELKRLPAVTVFNSSANFLLFKLSSSSSLTVSQVQERLMKKGISVRTCEDFQGLDDNFIRVAVKKKNDNKKLASELKKILAS